jgi:L-ascorbate metabolism protein UlaG (beta-lactamase superfamily)
VITDPFDKSVGLPTASLSADIVTVSHQHGDHNNVSLVKGTARRSDPFVIEYPGEYEILETSVFGVDSFHDVNKGEERGKNTMFVIHMDDVAVAHLGDLGEKLSDKQLEELNGVDVLLCPVGGVYTIDPEKAVETINAIQPGYVIPMHYKTNKHTGSAYTKLATVDDFLKEIGTSEPKRMGKLSVSSLSIPEETEVVVLES